MERLVLLLVISVACLCDAGLSQYNNNGSLTANDGEMADRDIDRGVACGGFFYPADGPLKTHMEAITGGADYKYKEFPWMVALFAPRTEGQQCGLTDNDCWIFSCTGSLISSKVVITTASCVYAYKQQKLKARAGDWNLDTLEEPLPHQERYVAKYVIHELYYNSRLDYRRNYDVSLLVLETRYILTDNIGFICLPQPDWEVNSESCKTAGWSVQDYGDNGHQQLLQVVDMNYVDHDKCQSTLRRKWRSRFVLHDSYTCTIGVQDKDTCRRDLGSPLMCVDEYHYYLRGLSSWAVRCGNPNMPRVYTDVVKVRTWIDEKMRANGFNTDTYTHVIYCE